MIVLNDIQAMALKHDLIDFTQVSEGDDRAMSSCAFMGRMFAIMFTDGEYYPFEYTPTGVLISGPEDNLQFDYARLEEIKAAYHDNPNDFEQFCEQESIDINEVARSGGGYSVGTIFYQSLDAAMDAVLDSITSNTILKSFRTQEEMDAEKSEAQLHQEKIDAVRSKIAYFQGQIMPASQTATLLGDKQSMFGSGLTDDSKKSILSYMNNPTLEGWEEIRSLTSPGQIPSGRCCLRLIPAHLFAAATSMKPIFPALKLWWIY